MLNCVSSHMYTFTLGGLCRLNLCLCDCIWRMQRLLPGAVNEMQTTQAESSGDVIYALLLRQEEGRDVARCLSICVCVYARALGDSLHYGVCEVGGLCRQRQAGE